jgi:hypothetical protein
MARKRGFGPIEDILPIDWAWSNMGWTKEQQDILWQDLHDTTNFWTHELDPLPQVDQFLVKELANKTDVSFQSAQWLRWNFGILYPTVIVSNEKGPVAAALKYDYFLDDRPKNCYEVKAARPECKVFLCESSHNQDESTRKVCAELDIPRITGFNEFAKMILEETNGK